MEGPQIYRLEEKFRFLPRAQKRILIDARNLKGDRFESAHFDRRVEIGSAGKAIKTAINEEFGIDIDDIRINGQHGGFFKSEINGGALNGGYTDIAFPTGILNVFLVFRCFTQEELDNKTPSSTALVIKGNVGSL